ERLGTTGALLGAVADGVWEEREVRLSPGSTLLLYTDGVTEARDQARFFGEGRVHRALRPGGSASAVAQRLMSMVQRFSQGEMRDDAAILVVRYEPDPGRDVTDEAGSGM
ncbi:MAG TPA: serine/threonine-protein phosphatase, partial [Actinobacteria bacterium]|nr:serine/threonine-protein phosphatase [Actinomycetota bacterium]